VILFQLDVFSSDKKVFYPGMIAIGHGFFHTTLTASMIFHLEIGMLIEIFMGLILSA